MSIATLTRRDVQRMADAPIFQRGEEYLAHGLVEERQRTPDGIRAAVRGSSSYRVDVGHGPHFRCTCPFEFSGPCKHVVATLLAFIDQPDSFQRPDPLKRVLRGRGKDELVALLAEIFAEQPDLARRYGFSPAPATATR